MWRLVLIVFLAAGIGSVVATVTCSFLPDVFGPGPTFESLRFVLNISVATMVFTVPGATMLVGLQARLKERDLPGWVVSPAIVVAGGVAGGLVFLALNMMPIWVGALYGTLTAVALLLVERLPGLSPAATR